MTEPEVEKRVSWAELFFDLVFVVAVTRVSALIEDDHTWGGILRAVIVFVPVYWTWVGMAVQTNLLDTSRPLMRIRMFAVALCGIFMAISMPDAYGSLGTLFACSYWAARIILATNQVGSIRAGRFSGLNPSMAAAVVTGPLLVIGSLFEGGTRELIWGLVALLDLSTPRIFRSRMAAMHVNAAHLTERFGLFVLIALGESVVSIATLTTGIDVPTGVAVAAAFALSCGLWWVYFHFAADAMRHSLTTARVQLDITRLVLSYGHLAFIAAIIVVAVGLHDAIAHPTEHLHWAIAGLLFGGTAMFLATFGFTRWTMFHLMSWTRLIAATVVLAVMPIAPLVPALASLIGLAVLVAALNVIEMARVSTIGWRARLDRRSVAARSAVDPP